MKKINITGGWAMSLFVAFVILVFILMKMFITTN